MNTAMKLVTCFALLTSANESYAYTIVQYIKYINIMSNKTIPKCDIETGSSTYCWKKW